LAAKHNVTQDEVEDVFFSRPGITLSNRGADQVKMCTPLGDRRMPAGT
jgi:hypothetical protein